MEKGPVSGPLARFEPYAPRALMTKFAPVPFELGSKLVSSHGRVEKRRIAIESSQLKISQLKTRKRCVRALSQARGGPAENRHKALELCLSRNGSSVEGCAGLECS